MRRPLPVRVALSVVALSLEAALLAWGLGGWRALVHEPRALTLLAIWGVGGITLAVLQPGRGQDVVESERDPLAMLVLLIAPLFTPALAAYGGRVHLWMLPAAKSLAWLGVALAAAGLALRVVAMAQLGARFSPLVALQRAHALETGGVYAWIRHPGYLGALAASLGSALAFGSALALPLWLLMLLAELVRVRREEAFLARHFGAAWTAHTRRTGALLPRLRPLPKDAAPTNLL